MARRACRWCLGLGDYVARRTAATVARDLAGAGQPVSRSTVYAWARGQSQPRPAAGRALVETSAGALSLSDIYRAPDSS